MVDKQIEGLWAEKGLDRGFPLAKDRSRDENEMGLVWEDL
jgi:hypothetical protein